MHKPTGKAEPRFDLDFSYGRDGELRIAQFLGWIESETGQVEVKRKRPLDLKFYIETHCDKGRRGVFHPSGILGTIAKSWAFLIADTNVAVFLPTDLIREMLNDPSTKDCAETDGDCPTRGKLIDLVVTLYRLKQRANANKGRPSPKPSASKVDHELVADELTW